MSIVNKFKISKEETGDPPLAHKWLNKYLHIVNLKENCLFHVLKIIYIDIH